MVNKWIKEAGNSKYGSKVNEVLIEANENLRKASDFVNNKIDEFGEKVTGKKYTSISSEINTDIVKNVNKKLNQLVPKKYVDRATESISAMPETKQKEIMDFIEKLNNDFGKKKTMQEHHWIEKSRIGKKKYQFLKNPSDEDKFI